MPLAGGQEISLDKITPELAAKIVKFFILPMFENAPVSRHRKRLGQGLKPHEQGGIYKELKLSEQLQQTLDEVKSEVLHLTESLEREQQRSSMLDARMRAMRLKTSQKEQEVVLLRSLLAQQEADNKQMKEFASTIRNNVEVLRKLSDKNDNLRRRAQQELQVAKSESDSYMNKIFELEQNKRLYSVKYEVLEEQFNLLFNSIQTISNAKNLEDKYIRELELCQKRVLEQNKENEQLQSYVRETTAERDQYRRNTAQLLDIKIKLEKEKFTAMDTFKKRVFELDREMKKKTEEANDAFEQKVTLEKEKKLLIAEREKMKERIKKLKQRKGRFDIAQKVCKNCGKDYLEKENYNWSCRTHRSEFSGEIWWCCGKENKD